MKELINKLERAVSLYSSSNTVQLNRVQNPAELKAYCVGLADALEMVKEYEESRLKVGQKYFVIQYDKHEDVACPYKMTLYKISETKNGMNYCFARNPPGDPDVVLHSKVGLKSRVFKTQEEAQAGVKPFLLSLKK